MGATTDVVGVGIDLCGVERMAAALERTPRLAERLFTPSELQLLERSGGIREQDPVGPGAAPGAATLASVLFATKEAVMKALGSGIDSIPFGCVEVGSGEALAGLLGGVVGAGERIELGVSLSGAALRRAGDLGAVGLEVTAELLEGPAGEVALVEVLARA